jgi:tetratricopeptide (TPR) repeat protein
MIWPPRKPHSERDLATKQSNQAPGFSAFISYAKADAKKAQAIAEGLEKRGFKCWIAPRDVKAGRAYGDEIIRGIESAKAFILVLSKASNDSAFVAREVERAVSKKKPILAVRLADIQPAPALELFISGTQWIDAFPGRLVLHVGRLADLLAEEEGAAPGAGTANGEPPTARKLSRWAMPLGVAAAVLLVLGAGAAFWSARQPLSDTPEQSNNALDTRPIYLPEPDSGPTEEMAAKSSDTEMIVGGKPEVHAREKSAASLGLAERDPDYRACETGAGGAEAIKACDRAIASGKFAGRNLSYLYSDRGFMRMQTGELALALADLNEAIRIDPSNFYAFWNRGAVYTAEGEFDLARADLDKALDLNPDKISRAKIQEALNVVNAAARAVNSQSSDPSVITVPTWGDGQDASAAAAPTNPTDAMPVSPPVAVTPALPAAPSPMPVR